MNQDFEEMKKQATEASGILKAIANETRLLILCSIIEDDFTVNQLSEIKKSYNRVVESCLHHDFEFEKFMCEDLDLIDLSRWKYLDG